MDIGVWHNGGTSLDVKSAENGLKIPNASIAEMHEDRKRIVTHQVDHGVLAEECGFDRYTLTEHHFVLTGTEFNPNPLMTHTAVAARTERIQLRQMANILPWHDPVRLAEQIALLDVISDGRTEVGIGRGYQPREAEVLGQYWGGTIQNEEKNRACFEEKVDILLNAWTDDLLSFSGEFHQIPPTYTKWHNPTDRAYLSDDVTEYDVSDVLDWHEGNPPDGTANIVTAGRTTLKSLPVFPQPLQAPHPPIWQPVASPRSIEYAARNGFNAYIPGGGLPMIREIIDRYYEAAEAAGWPDRRPDLDGEPFDRGWDPRRQRGVTLAQPVFNSSIVDGDTVDRYKRGLVMLRQSTGWFGFGRAIAEDDEDPIQVLWDLDADKLIDREVVCVGDADAIVHRLMTMEEVLELDQLSVDIVFEGNALTPEENDAQLVAFAEEVMPRL